MYTVIRIYSSPPKLADDLVKRSKEIENLITTIPGFMAYYLLKTNEGITSVTVCENRTGCDESSRRAATWLAQNMPEMKIGAPQVIGGELAIKFTTFKTASV